MLNTFPALLNYSFFAPTLLRVALALMLGGLAYKHFAYREELSRVRFPVIGAGGRIIWLSIVVEALTALGLFVGYHTQIFAIIAALIGLKHLIWSGKYPRYFIYERSTAFFILVIALSLLVSGAGAMAIDLPL